MQLKRDTDYAVRILYCLHQNRVADKPAERKGATLSEMAMRTGIPKVVVGRICEILEENGLIDLIDDQTEAEKAYGATDGLLNCSLLDVVKAVEGGCEILAVFDRRSEMYKNCEEQLLKLQRETDNLFSRTTLKTIFQTKATIQGRSNDAR